MTFLTIPSNKKSLPNCTLIDTNILICSLFTLVPTDNLFKELNISRYYCSTLVSEDTFILDSVYLDKLFLLLNNPLVKQLAYNILQPLLQETSNRLSPILNTENNSIGYIEQQLLKKYLKKFKYFYNLFFLEKSLLLKYKLTDREINFLAIKFLFILVGIESYKNIKPEVCIG